MHEHLERPPGYESGAGFPSGEFRPLGRSIKDEWVGRRVDACLGANYKFLARAAWQRRIEDGWLTVNGQRVRTKYRLREGDQLFFYHAFAREPEVDRSLPILYQHEGVMAVLKPPRLPMHENGPYRTNTLAHILRDVAGPEWAAVHRLDLETSGVVLCGASLPLRQHLAAQLADRKVIKRYLAIVCGRPKEDVWRVDAPIGDLEDSEIRIKRWVQADGQPAVTDFELLETSPSHSLIRCFPRTGRTNQIRIHAAYSGVPLLGDKLYHPDEQVFLDYFDKGNTEDVIDRAGHFRCALHAEAITFKHPATGEIVEIEAPLFHDLQELWGRLRVGDATSMFKNPLDDESRYW